MSGPFGRSVSGKERLTQTVLNLLDHQDGYTGPRGGMRPSIEPNKGLREDRAEGMARAWTLRPTCLPQGHISAVGTWPDQV